jgi:hypothetical protein
MDAEKSHRWTNTALQKNITMKPAPCLYPFRFDNVANFTHLIVAYNAHPSSTFFADVHLKHWYLSVRLYGVITQNTTNTESLYRTLTSVVDCTSFNATTIYWLNCCCMQQTQG